MYLLSPVLFELINAFLVIHRTVVAFKGISIALFRAFSVSILEEAKVLTFTFFFRQATQAVVT